MARKGKVSRKTKETSINVEVNIDGKTGFLSDVGDIEKMANDTISLLSDIDMLNRFKMNALAHANSFALENILPKYKEIYEKLCCRIEDK